MPKIIFDVHDSDEGSMSEALLEFGSWSDMDREREPQKGPDLIRRAKGMTTATG